MTAASRSCYVLLVIVSVTFVVTVMAFTLLPWETLPFWLKEQLLPIVLVEVGAIVVLGLLSMSLDKPPSSPFPQEPPKPAEAESPAPESVV
jgi:hypothetical protein